MTKSILSTVALASLCLLPLHKANASQPVLTSVVKATAELKEPAEAPQDVIVRHTISVGFNESPQLQASLRTKLAATGRYLMHDEPQIPSTPAGMFVGGLATMHAEHGWVSCHARYFVVAHPGFAALQIETVAASVPLMQVRIFRGRPEVLELAQEACSAELADQIVENMSKIR